MRRPIALASLAAMLALPAAADRPDWLCLGTEPGFMMTLSGDRATFDYLGDGVYALDPPVPAEAPAAASRHDLVAARQRIAVFVEARACRVLGTVQPVAIEVAIPTSLGLRPLSGCCKPNGG